MLMIRPLTLGHKVELPLAHPPSLTRMTTEFRPRWLAIE